MTTRPAPGPRTAAWLFGTALALAILPHAIGSRYDNDAFSLMSGGLRVLRGDMIYGEFWEFMAPVPFWLLTGAYALFGASLRTTHWVVGLNVWLVGWLLAKATDATGAPRWAGWLAAFAWVFAAFTHWAVFSHHWVASLAGMAAAACGIRAIATGAAWPWFLAGVLTAVTGFSVQPDGPAIGLGLAAGLALDAAARRRPWRAVLRDGAALAGGALAGLAAFAAVLAATGSLGAAIADIVVWPTQHYKQAGASNDIALGTDVWVWLLPRTGFPNWHLRAFHVLGTYVLTLAGTLGGVAFVLARLRRGAAGWTAADGAVGLLTTWAVFSFLAMTRGRADYVHVSMYAVPAIGLAAALAGKAWGAGVARKLPAAFLAAMIATGALGTAHAIRKEPGTFSHPLDPDARLLATPALAWLRAHVRPGDTIAALPYGGLFYFYVAPPATSHSLMYHPSFNYTTQAEWEGFWAEVAAAKPRFIVITGSTFAEIGMASYRARVPAGYREVGAFASPQAGPAYPAWIYERVDGAGGKP